MHDRVEKIPSWLRWVLTPIASAVTFAAVTVVGNIAAKIMVFITSPRGGWSENFFEYLLVPGFAGFYAVIVVELLAPKAKRMTAIIVAGVWILLAGAMTFFSVLTSEWKNLLYVIAVVVGVGSAVMNIDNSAV